MTKSIELSETEALDLLDALAALVEDSRRYVTKDTPNLAAAVTRQRALAVRVATSFGTLDIMPPVLRELVGGGT